MQCFQSSCFEKEKSLGGTKRLKLVQTGYIECYQPLFLVENILQASKKSCNMSLYTCAKDLSMLD
jgi:hypothetical protein